MVSLVLTDFLGRLPELWCGLVIQSCPALCNPMELWPSRLFCAWDFPGKNTGMDSHFLLQGLFPTRGSNLGLLH